MVLGIGGTVSLLGVFLSSFTRSLGEYLSLYCGMNGLGCGMSYFVALICSWEYFPHKKGLVTGIILGGYGFGSFIFAQISTNLVNPTGAAPTVYDPDNDVTYFDAEIADRVPYMIRTLVYIWIVLVLVGVLLITRKSNDEGSEPSEQGQNVMTVESESNEKHLNHSANGGEILTTGEDPRLTIRDETEVIRGVKYCFYSIRTW